MSVERLLVDLRIVGLVVACHRWQLALAGISLLSRPSIREAMRYDPLSDEKAATLAAMLVGYNDVPQFVAEQRLVTTRLKSRKEYWLAQRAQLRKR